jgi:hypothetical protein
MPCPRLPHRRHRPTASIAAATLAALALGCTAEPAADLDARPAETAERNAALSSRRPWSESQIVTAPGAPAAFANFGLTPTVCGNLAVVGAWHADLPATGGAPAKVDAGAAYVFERRHTRAPWTLTATLTAGDAAAGDSFGFAVACHGDTIAVGAMFADPPGAGGSPLVDAGAVYLFERRSDSWQQTQKLVALDAAPSDAFGFALSMTGDGLLIGAPYVDAKTAPVRLDVGAAYVYTRVAAGYAPDAKLQARDGAASDFLGRAVALSGETALVGAMYRDVAAGSGTATDAGAAYVFERGSDRWNETQLLTADDPGTRDLFAFAVALDRDVAVVGAYLADLPDGAGGLSKSNAGAAYVFERRSGRFAPQQKLVAPDARRDDYFGSSVAVAGDRLLVGALYADIALPDGSVKTNGGAVYAFRRRSNAWRLQDRLVASDVGDRDVLGRSIALFDQTAILAAPGKGLGGLPEVGAAYFFEYAPFPLGTACSGDTGAIDCDSGFCSDGVCCDSACGGGISDCQGCRAAQTGGPDGICAPLRRGAVCRPRNPANACDLDDVCDGTSPACPTVTAPAGTPCRAREFCGQCTPRGTCEATRLCR